mgnify:CR=1 FL=1
MKKQEKIEKLQKTVKNLLDWVDELKEEMLDLDLENNSLRTKLFSIEDVNGRSVNVPCDILMELQRKARLYDEMQETE